MAAGRILSVHNLGEVPTLFVLCKMHAEEYGRNFLLVSTNQPFDLAEQTPAQMAASIMPKEVLDKKYIGSFALSGGARVYHLFEKLVHDGKKAT